MPTTPRGLPYPTSSDPVALGAANIQALAEAIETLKELGFWYEPAAGYIRAARGVQIDKNVYVGLDGSGAGVYFGPDADTVFYRAGGNVLSAGGSLNAAWHMTATGYLDGALSRRALYGPDANANYKHIGGSAALDVDAGGGAVIALGGTFTVVTATVSNGDPINYPYVSVGATATADALYVRAWTGQAIPYTGPLRVNWQAVIQI